MYLTNRMYPSAIWQGVLLVGLILSSLYVWPPAVLNRSIVWNLTRQTPNSLGYFIFIGMSALPLLTGGWLIQTTVRQWQRTRQEKRRAIGLILTATLFFALSSGIILLQVDWLPKMSTSHPHTWAILAISFDLELLGFAIAYLDAFEQGEALWPDFLRSLHNWQNTAAALIAKDLREQNTH